MGLSTILSYRGSNSFLKKQLDSCMQTIKASQADAVTERTKLKQQLEESESSYRLLEKRLILTQQDLKRSEDSLFSVNEMLKAERKRCEQLSEKILLMEKEKDELIRGWSSFRAKIK